LYHTKVEECAQLQAQLAQATTQLASYETQLTQAVKGADEAAQYVDELAKSVKGNRMLRETVDARDKYIEQLQQQLAQCQQERDELKARYRVTPAPMPRTVEQVLKRHAEIGHTLGSCSLEADYVPTLHDEQWQHVEVLKQDLARLRQVRDAFQEGIENMRTERTQLQRQYSKVCDERNRLRQELKAKYDEMNEREAFHASCANEAEELRVALREENATLRQRVGDLEQENAALAKTIDEVAR
jgi:chromosome segregation ATPase